MRALASDILFKDSIAGKDPVFTLRTLVPELVASQPMSDNGTLEF